MSLDPTADSTLRTSDAEREHIVAALGQHLSVGRLNVPTSAVEELGQESAAPLPWSLRRDRLVDNAPSRAL
jgi:hypothetical protein